MSEHIFNTEIARLERELADSRSYAGRLETALKFYADEGNYKWDGVPMTPYVDGEPDPNAELKDRGRIARLALGPKCSQDGGVCIRPGLCDPDNDDCFKRERDALAGKGWCICADPENCTQPLETKLCRRAALGWFARAPEPPLTPYGLAIDAIRAARPFIETCVSYEWAGSRDALDKIKAALADLPAGDALAAPQMDSAVDKSAQVQGKPVDKSPDLQGLYPSPTECQHRWVLWRRCASCATWRELPEGPTTFARIREIADFPSTPGADMLPDLMGRLESIYHLANGEQFPAGVTDERVLWLRSALTNDLLVREIAMQLKPYQPISEENVRELLDDIRQGIAIYIDDTFPEQIAVNSSEKS